MALPRDAAVYLEAPALSRMRLIQEFNLDPQFRYKLDGRTAPDAPIAHNGTEEPKDTQRRVDSLHRLEMNITNDVRKPMSVYNLTTWALNCVHSTIVKYVPRHTGDVDMGAIWTRASTGEMTFDEIIDAADLVMAFARANVRPAKETGTASVDHTFRSAIAAAPANAHKVFAYQMAGLFVYARAAVIDHANAGLDRVREAVRKNAVETLRDSFAKNIDSGRTSLTDTQKWLASVLSVCDPPTLARLRAEDPNTVREVHTRGVMSYILMDPDELEAMGCPEILMLDQFRLSAMHSCFDSITLIVAILNVLSAAAFKPEPVRRVAAALMTLPPRTELSRLVTFVDDHIDIVGVPESRREALFSDLLHASIGAPRAKARSDVLKFCLGEATAETKIAAVLNLHIKACAARVHTLASVNYTVHSARYKTLFSEAAADLLDSADLMVE